MYLTSECLANSKNHFNTYLGLVINKINYFMQKKWFVRIKHFHNYILNNLSSARTFFLVNLWTFNDLN